MDEWAKLLSAGDVHAAWDSFISRYRRLIQATIRTVARDRDDAMDAFAQVCASLSSNDLARLRRFSFGEPKGARFSTWLVVVVRNLAIDWRRGHERRREIPPPPGLSIVQRAIYGCVFVDGRSHREAYELIGGSQRVPLTFGEFLREVRATYRIVREHGGDTPTGGVRASQRQVENDTAPETPLPNDDAQRALENALDTLSSEDRLAVLLFVVDEASAADVARALRWANAKTVYNRVYRALAAIRVHMETHGLRREDLV